MIKLFCILQIVFFSLHHLKADAADDIVERMTDEELAGQMMIVGIDGDILFSGTKDRLSRIKPGGIIIQNGNISSPGKLRNLTRDLQIFSKGRFLPLFLAADQEGGAVNRISEGLTLFPGALASARSAEMSAFRDAMKITGYELRRLGINMNFAPCADLLDERMNPVIHIRSFGSDALRTSAMTSDAVQGLQYNKNCIAVVKHFPGHGMTSADSHAVLPVVSKNRKVTARDLLPFKSAADAGAAGMMMAHVLYPDLGSSAASLSPSVHRLAREALAFRGIIITDDICMKSVSGSRDPSGAAREAFHAGADMILAADSSGTSMNIFYSLKHLIAGSASAGRKARASVKRIIKAKVEFSIMNADQGGYMRNLYSGSLDPELFSRRDEINNELSLNAVFRFSRFADRESVFISKETVIAADNFVAVEYLKRLGFAPVSVADCVSLLERGKLKDKKICLVTDSFPHKLLTRLKTEYTQGRIYLYIVLVKNPFPIVSLFKKHEMPPFICSFSPTPVSMKYALDAACGTIRVSEEIPPFLRDMLVNGDK